MIAETLAYRALISDEQLNQLFDNFRGKPFGNGFKQGIFTYDIPEQPVSCKKKELAPFLRINAQYDNVFFYSDDKFKATEQRIVIHFWCEKAKQSEAIANRIDEVLEKAGFERYTTNEKPRYKDSDIDLLMNVRKYRFFDFKNKGEING